jgi:hypothetical protein
MPSAHNKWEDDMDLSTFMIIKAVSSIVIGGVLLVNPGLFLTMVGISNSQGAAIYGRFYGAACIGIFLLTWFARNAEESLARWAIILDLCVYDAIGFFVTLVFLLLGEVNPYGWLFAAVYLFFAISFGYFLMRQKMRLSG